MIERHNLVPQWSQAQRTLLSGHSVIVHAPRFFGHRSFAKSLSRLLRLGGINFIFLNANDLTSGKTLDYNAIIDFFHRRLKVHKPRHTYKANRHNSAPHLAEVIKNTSKRNIILLMAGGRGWEPLDFELISILQGVLDISSSQASGDLAVCVLDDFSLYYYERWRTQHISGWSSFSERLYINVMKIEDLTDAAAGLTLTERTTIQTNYLDIIYDLTGGHPGLACELIRDIQARAGRVPPDYWPKHATRLLRDSDISQTLGRAISEDPKALCSCALSFLEPKSLTNDTRSPEIQLLRQLGILQWVRPATAILCGGVIRELVQEIAAPVILPANSARKKLLHFSFENNAPGTNDMIVVHMSDLHIGGDPFRKSGSASLENRARRSAGELLSRDLERLKLTDRVDALIISGDFSSRGKIGELRRAREVVEELMKAAGLDKERLLVIAGNHDLDWAPEEQDHKVVETGISRDNYATFRELLDKPKDPPAELLEVPSRSGRTVLRILGLDSNYVEGEKAGGTGFINPEAFDLSRALLRESAARHPGRELATWIVVHHHVVPVGSAEVRRALDRRVSVMGNAADLLEFAAEVGAEAILHGHEHQPLVTISRRWSNDEVVPDFHPVVILGAGSFSSPPDDLGPFRRNHYFLLYRRPGDLIVRSRELGETGLAFVKHRDLRLPR